MGVVEGDPFYILVKGAPITKPILEDNNPVQASLIASPERAIFTYNASSNHLECEGLYLGRNLVEDRSLLPKKVVWSRDPERLLPVKTDENDPGKLRFSGGLLTVMNGQLFASLMGEEEPTVELVLV
ncbi:hypothetical protein N7468_000197 [Penicillium chermesinum]|uniref:Uncharacterized protein n=1 Tax=Penicillium chermesinum TaxID=63820 RepID=A0A9W9PJT3_9EURO|nr:uncharacterized protein N7468_000197 [Penicillium chermesinum]KAJ5248746.1 hypothetical protein N7468_000197 [Penicillium chermesinum]KAJ6150852.1 hypothetical protein N7470_007446 [Penicillium chermesinum]